MKDVILISLLFSVDEGKTCLVGSCKFGESSSHFLLKGEQENFFEGSEYKNMDKFPTTFTNYMSLGSLPVSLTTFQHIITLSMIFWIITSACLGVINIFFCQTLLLYEVCNVWSFYLILDISVMSCQVWVVYRLALLVGINSKVVL